MNSEDRPHICIITFATVHDRRLLRQVEHFADDFNLTVICFDEIKRPGYAVDWQFIDKNSSLPRKLIDRLLVFSGKLLPPLYNVWLWTRPRYKEALRLALEVEADIYQANDWAALPIVIEAAKRKRCKAVFDAHEYWALESENQHWWKVFVSPLIQYTIDRYARKVDGFITVSPPIVERYRTELGIDPLLIMNIPTYIEPPPSKDVDPHNIRLINHGTAAPDRQLETMIRTIPLTDKRFTLDFYLLEVDAGYIDSLKSLAEQIAPGRVHFHPPVPASEILQKVAEYDVGIYIMAPVSYNNHMALPNRFFDFMMAGLAVCVGPSPAMKQIVEQYGYGFATSSFEPRDIATALNALTSDHITEMKQAAHKAAKILNAENEMSKFKTYYHQLLEI